ncbi:glycoside hydrolase TIM-barrel-like domain-containing protein [Roseobacter sp. YSTF-M11]|uniref:Glycoside hydrolase TIM-barrel-like domain-containing protein n=1 Tax=Roseobacter insulae TaxID=2859783 RepID=A0A9X1FWA8_9RHOB|nr:glycoside hydrolase TIM-barrel-like domain-containing protein [Roseobacter insulae]MBW4708544.1 glycoside hydrolase TIM-barrel-like domain-containing protein [Roseobacter insulae]
MATIVLSAVGAAVGGSIGGSVAGLSTAVIGRAVGATVGKMIDQRLLGQGSDVVTTGQVDRFRISSVGEGEVISQVYGRMRLGGQVIWASDFQETVTVSGGGGGGGKGAPSQPQTRKYSYTVNLAVAICEGEITRVGRIWANGEEIAPDDLNLRIYKGSAEQLPDPVMEAIEGTGMVPAYRGTAYAVIENLDLERFGNRVPQFSFEVSRPEQIGEADADQSLTYGIRSVALIPGTGEYSLATTPVHYTNGPGSRWSANVNTPAEKPDFCVSLEALVEELPNCQAASLVVSWFGNDLRCGNCSVRPKVEKKQYEGENMPWTVAGLTRASAQAMVQENGRPIYGGTPTDQSVIQAIQAMHAAGKKVMFYPFILMDQLSDNMLPNPYAPEEMQPRLPWRGRITLSVAPGVDGSPDGSAAATTEVDAFFGSATAADYSTAGGVVSYSGPQEWTLSRFVLHYAALCKLAGGVEAFCISSEMRGLTQIRGPGNSFVAVERLRALAGEVRAVLGAGTKISYAADWSEYFGYQPQDGSNDRYFHLDPLWADANIDFIGIDNYMPISDWRDGDDHLDVDAGTIYDLDYLRGNVAGGEGYDWYYASDDARNNQIRTPIEDQAHNEPWIYRYKDIRNWWSNPHHDRVAGQRSPTASPWVPGSKPVWFTEMGCAAIDKGTNEPNKFLDAKSSESSLPKYSNGARDDFMQAQYLRTMASYWGDPANNPVSSVYAGPMVDMDRAFVWAWDARPYPYFPNTSSLWSDSENYGRGHWLNGRTSARSLASVVAEVCAKAGLTDVDTSQLYGTVRGYLVDDVNDARASLQPLMLRYSFDAIERDGKLIFKMRDGRGAVTLDRAVLALSTELDGAVEQTRAAQAEMAGRVRLRFVQADAEFDVLAEEAVLADEQTHAVSTSEMPIALTRVEGRQVAERWLTEARVARDAIRFALPPSCLTMGAGDVVALNGEQAEGKALYRIDRVEQGMLQIVEAVRIEPDIYTPSGMDDEVPTARPVVPAVPVLPLFLDLPLITGDENPYAPHVAITAQPWPGSVALYTSPQESDFKLLSQFSARSIIGKTQTEIVSAPSGRLDRGAALEVKLSSGTLSSVDIRAVLSGANLAAIGDGHPNNWEVFQFTDAELVAENTYRLTNRLRGQLGTEGIMPDVWPADSWFVLLNGLPEQMDLSRNLRRVAQTYRIGPARRPVDDASYIQETHAFDGNGLRPYAPAHLRAKRADDGTVVIDWIRRTRVDGDSWDVPEIPLGEESEAYVVRIIKDGVTVREVSVAQPKWHYSLANQLEDSMSEPFTIEVGQVSAAYGLGLSRRFEMGV